MQFTQEFNVDTFPFWGPARLVVDEIRRAKKMGGLQEAIETAFCDTALPSKTEINDYVWSESEFILQLLGLRSSPDDNDEEEGEEAEA